ncbi:DUF1642 domain-containing protein [Listeria seeligeri]|uniref:DUF1642 domain-containing protein n=1 Tax=Listeria seeligeri TaxID=1640 RepID=UPI00164CFFDE|nr:DUF1642 domain-containing protein [Listeria seeligeri]MBC6160741.1 DUF1642 domain-containing protein [Listeria seeligeri]
MQFKVGDKVNFIDKGRLHVGTVVDFDTVGETNFRVVYDNGDHEGRKLWVEEAELALVELPRIPKDVAGWICKGKSIDRDLLSTLDIENPAMPGSISKWLCNNTGNQHLFARAWLDGYEVEQEPLYYIKVVDSYWGFINLNLETGEYSTSTAEEVAVLKTKFTESEIKNMDEKYWAFAVPVEEVAE